MNQQPQMYCGVTVKPDKEEKKQIRRDYAKVGIVILFNVIMFNVVLKGLLYVIGGFYGGITSLSSFYTGTLKMLTDHPALKTVVSCFIPIISETLAIFIGIKLLKLDLKKLFTFNGFNGGDMVRLGTVSLGLQTVAAVLAAAIGAILSMFGLESATADVNINADSLAATLFLYFYACLLGPVLEELLYRGVVLQGLRKYNERFAIIISALIFGLMHQNYQQFLLGFLLGLVLAYVALRSESLLPSMITHIIVNTSGVLASLIMQNADHEAFASITGGNYDITSFSGSFMTAVIMNALFRYGFLFAAIALMIVAMVKGRVPKKPTPAGKSRGWPVLMTSVVWYLIFAAYLFLTFIQPFMY